MTTPTSRSKTTRPVVIIDDGLIHGGGQIGLGRYLMEQTGLTSGLILLTPGPLTAIGAESGVKVALLQNRKGFPGLILAWIRWVLRGRKICSDSVAVANSFKAALVLAAVPRRGNTLIYYLREDLSKDWISGWKRFVACRIALARFDGFVANSAWTASTIPDNLSRKPVRIAFPLCGLSGPVEVRGARPFDRRADRLRVLSLSRITPWKGIETVVAAVGALADDDRLEVKLTLAGSVGKRDRRYLDDVLARGAASAASVEYLGHVTDVASLLAGHDVLVVGSQHPEPFGQVIIQALAAGLPVVATAHGGPVEILRAEPMGHLVDPSSHVSMAAALRNLVDSPPTECARAKTSARVHSNFGDTYLAKQFDDAISALVQSA